MYPGQHNCLNYGKYEKIKIARLCIVVQIQIIDLSGFSRRWSLQRCRHIKIVEKINHTKMYCMLRSIFQSCFRLMAKVKLKYVCFGVAAIVVLDFFGAFTHLFETTFDDNFVYPYHGDLHQFVGALRHNEKPDLPPMYEYNYSYIFDIRDKCVDNEYKSLRVVYLVKSAIGNFDRRIGIRNSWGFEKRFFDVPTRTVFLLGTHPDDPALQARVKAEAARYRDIVQADFVDAYYNNTIKTMLGFKWAVKYCGNSKFYMFVDDDMYVSVKNVLRFVRNPTSYPDYLKEPKKLHHKREIGKFELLKVLNDSEELSKKPEVPKYKDSVITDRQKRATAKEKIMLRRRPGWTSHNKSVFPAAIIKQNISSVKTRMRRQIFDFELPEDVRLFAGFVFVSSPHRHKTSKWFVSLKEYPYHLWPPYVTAGAYILSKEALLDMYYTSLYTKHFRFDDIYLGLVAKKAEIEPFHCEEFHFYKKDYTKFNYKYVISSHGYDDPNELLQVWNEQKAMGNA